MKLLFIIPHELFPINSGNKTLTFNLLKGLTRQKEVFIDLVVLSNLNDSANNIFLEKLKIELPNINNVNIFNKPTGFKRFIYRFSFFIRNYPPSLGSFYNVDLGKWLKVNCINYDFICFDMFHTAIYEQSCPKNVSKILIASDCYSYAAKTAFNLSDSLFYKIRLLYNYYVMLNFEKKKYLHFDFVFTVSNTDLCKLKIISPNSKILKIGIGVGDEYFSSFNLEKRFNKDFKGILLTGSLNHPIIAKDIINFLSSNLTLFKSDLDDINIFILGKNPHPTLVDFVNNSGINLKHVDFVTDYIEFLNQDWIYIYCQQCGSGLQTKLQQAMSLGLPTIGYKVAYDGIESKSEQNCFIVHSFAEMGQRVLDLYNNPQLRFSIGLNATHHILQNFNIDKVASDFLNYLRHEKKNIVN